MSVSYDQDSARMPANVNLYCAQCESQIGIFDNEWIRLTSSYARSKEKGTHFCTEVGNRTQVVPSGPAQRSAEGCVMAEVFCRKCSNMVGQYCKSAPDAEKQPLVDQYFYKLSRTFLKDSRTNTKIDPVFGYGSDMVKQSHSRSSLMPRSSIAPTSRWATTPLRQSSRTPSASVPALNRGSTKRSSQGSPAGFPNGVDQQTESIPTELWKLREDMASQENAMRAQSNAVSVQSARIDNLEAQIKNQDITIQDHENCLSAQATRIVEQDGVIQVQTKRLEEQQSQLLKITNQLMKLQNTMDDVKAALTEVRQNTSVARLTQGEPGTNNGDLETIVDAVKKAQNDAQELQSLQVENRAMKLRLSTIADAMGANPEILFARSITVDTTSPADTDASQVLGKRKRHENHRPASQEPSETSALEFPSVQVQTLMEQMPTPQASDDGRQTPARTSSEAVHLASNEKGQGQLKETANKKRSGKRENVLSKRKNAVNETGTDVSKEPTVVTQNQAENASMLQRADTTVQGLKEASAIPQNSTTTSVGAVRTRGRHSRSSNSTAIASTNDQDSFMQDDQMNDRPVARVATKMIQANQGPVSNKPMLSEGHVASKTVDRNHGLQSFSNIGQSQQPALSTMHTSASLAGANLQVLRASSQVLGQVSDPVQSKASHGNPEHQVQDHMEEMSRSHTSQENNRPNVPAFQTVTNYDATATGSSSHDYGNIEFVQNSGFDELVDSSDDEDDVMHTDTYLFGNDAADAATASQPESTATIDSQSGQNGTSHSEIETGVEREDRSMAPEPARRKKAPRIIRKSITLDRIHIATPSMFTAAYAAGIEPKLARPPPIQARQHALNLELVELGLSYWIGRNKKCKEYRAAVSAARARVRNNAKAAFLRSRGLNHNHLDPSSILPEGPIQRADNVSQSRPLSNVENVPAPVQVVSEEMVQLDSHSENQNESSKEKPRATRAQTRRSSVSLVSGLEETETQGTNDNSHLLAGKKPVSGRRKSQKRKSEAALDKTQATVTIDQPETVGDNAHDDTTLDGEALIGTKQKTATDKRRVKRSKPTRKLGGKAGEAVPSGTLSLPPEDIAEPVNSDGGAHDVQVTSTPVSTAYTTSASKDSITTTDTNETATSKASLQRREEAIMLRDRMAKELMEREDMDL